MRSNARRIRSSSSRSNRPSSRQEECTCGEQAVNAVTFEDRTPPPIMTSMGSRSVASAREPAKRTSRRHRAARSSRVTAVASHPVTPAVRMRTTPSSKSVLIASSRSGTRSMERRNETRSPRWLACRTNRSQASRSTRPSERNGPIATVFAPASAADSTASRDAAITSVVTRKSSMPAPPLPDRCRGRIRATTSTWCPSASPTTSRRSSGSGVQPSVSRSEQTSRRSAATTALRADSIESIGISSVVHLFIETAQSAWSSTIATPMPLPARR